MEMHTPGYWQEKLGIEFGMTKQEALEKFHQWREKKKTCERCECESYLSYCPVRLICEEAEEGEHEYESARGQIDSGSGAPEGPGDKEISLGQYEECAGLDVCEGV